MESTDLTGLDYLELADAGSLLFIRDWVIITLVDGSQFSGRIFKGPSRISFR